MKLEPWHTDDHCAHVDHEVSAERLVVVVDGGYIAETETHDHSLEAALMIKMKGESQLPFREI